MNVNEKREDDRAIRAQLIEAALSRTSVAIHNKHDGVDCVTVGRVVHVAKLRVTLVMNRSTEAVIPIDQIVTVRTFTENGAERASMRDVEGADK